MDEVEKKTVCVKDMRKDFNSSYVPVLTTLFFQGKADVCISICQVTSHTSQYNSQLKKQAIRSVSVILEKNIAGQIKSADKHLGNKRHRYYQEIMHHILGEFDSAAIQCFSYSVSYQILMHLCSLLSCPVGPRLHPDLLSPATIGASAPGAHLLDPC